MSTNNDANRIAACQELVALIPLYYKSEDSTALAEPTPRAIMEVIGQVPVVLYAQSLTGSDKLIQIRLPGITRFLKQLAESGVTESGEYQEVRYRFVKGKNDEIPHAA